MRIATLMSGSSGNAIYIETSKTKILVDAGQAGKRVAGELAEACGVSAAELDGIIVTHAHHDHIAGVGVMSRRYHLPIYATEGTWLEMESLIGPVPPENKKVITAGKKWAVGDLEIETFLTSHDALEPIGLVGASKKKRVGIVTDSGVFTSRMVSVLRGMDCLVLEANHDTDMLNNGPYPWPLKKRISGALGHLSNENAGKALLKTLGEATKNVVLAHLSAENNRPQLALQTVKAILAEEQVCLKEVDFCIAPRHKAGRCISF